MTPETIAQFQRLAKRYHLPPRTLFAALAYLAQSPTKKNLSREFRQFLLSSPAMRELAQLLITPPHSYAMGELDKALHAVWADEGEREKASISLRNQVVFDDFYWSNTFSALALVDPKSLIIAPDIICLEGEKSLSQQVFVQYPYYLEFEPFDVFVLHKERVEEFSPIFLQFLFSRRILFANKVFIIYGKQDRGDEFLQSEHEFSIREYIKERRGSRVVRSSPLGFCHIPKTAGTSFYQQLKGSFLNCIHFYKVEKFHSFAGKFQQYDVIAGHLYLPQLKSALGEESPIFVLLRDPKERFLSAVAHARHADSKAEFSDNMSAMRRMPLKEYIKTEFAYGELHSQLYITTDCFDESLDKMAASAISSLSSSNIHVGTVENLPAFYEKFYKITGVKINPNLKENVTPKKDMLISKQDIDIVEGIDFSADYLLYNWFANKN